jgi:hypothetical protein
MLGNKTADGFTVFVPSNKAMLKFLKLPATHTGAVNFTGTDLEATLQVKRERFINTDDKRAGAAGEISPFRLTRPTPCAEPGPPYV